MLKKDIINGLFLRNDQYVFTVFTNKDADTIGTYSLICLDKHVVVASYTSISDLKYELSLGYTLVGRFEELDIDSYLAEKTSQENNQ